MAMTIDELLESNWITVHYIPLPTTVRGFCVSNPDDSATIIINEKLSDREKLKALNHEIHHILSGELDDHMFFEYEE